MESSQFLKPLEIPSDMSDQEISFFASEA